jgi:glucose-6-phosphate isomerase
VSNLVARSGLAIELNDQTGELRFGDGVLVESTGRRTIGELIDVLAYPESAIGREDDTAYLLYRGVVREGDQPVFAETGLRYDITVTLPGDVGSEFMKTAGHIHNAAPDGVGYPEIYDVLSGSGAFVIQWDAPLRLTIVSVEPGDRVLLPPGASHLTVNTGKTPLVVADLVAIASENNYGILRENRGAAIYLLDDPEPHGLVRQLINPLYKQTPMWQTIEGSRMGDFPPLDGSLYLSFMVQPRDLAYLTAPGEMANEMASLWAERRAEK